MMRTTLAVILLAISLIGCEGTDIVNDPNGSHPAFHPVDGRDLPVSAQQPNKASGPTWPADADTGASSGTR